MTARSRKNILHLTAAKSRHLLAGTQRKGRARRSKDSDLDVLGVLCGEKYFLMLVLLAYFVRFKDLVLFHRSVDFVR
jgi:hypothetical protein